MINITMKAVLWAAVCASAAPTAATFARLYERLMSGQSAAQLEDALPRLSENLKVAAEVSREHWTDCTIVDELAKAEILPARAMAGLGVPRTVTGGVVHAPAGLMHTYGYLFSQLQTAYGLKSKRWLESRIDERLGLAAGAFGPTPPRGEFSSNVTWALLSLIGAPARLPHAATLTPTAKVLGRVEQRVTWRTPQGETVLASVLTHLVELPSLPGFETRDTRLLIYEFFRDGRHRLVTAFPIERGFAESIMATKPGREASFKPRFNLYVDPAWTVVAEANSGFIPRTSR